MNNGQHVNCLKNFDVIHCTEMTVRTIERCLPESLAFKWDEMLTKDDYPTFEKIIDFINNTVARLATQTSSDRQSKKRLAENAQQSNKRRKFDENSKHRTFFTKGASVCDVCKDGQHPLFKCPEFKGMHVLQRCKCVREKQLCQNCLRSHEGEKYTWTGCLVCNKNHNTLLHYSNFKGNNKSSDKKSGSNQA